MAYACRILADSISPTGHRLTTFELTHPRIVLAEVNTHKMISKSSASSRAVPVEKRIAAIEADPFVPEQFGKNKKGMQHDEVLDGDEAARARARWSIATSDAVTNAKLLAELGVHKQLANRLLEPFAWHTAVLSGTDWDNFFHLRVNPAAQGEFRQAAEMMLELYKKSEPTLVKVGEWHTPYLAADEEIPSCLQSEHRTVAAKVSAARCARVSYLTQNGKRDMNEDLALYNRLITPGHMAPLEHPARPMEPWELAATRQWNVHVRIDGVERFIRTSVPWHELRVGHEDFEVLGTPQEVNYLGNFNGWVQLRKLIPGEHDILGFRKEQTNGQ